MSDEQGKQLEPYLPDLARARLQSLRLADGKATLVLDVSGLDGLERDRLEVAAKDALRGAPGVKEVRVAMMGEKRARNIIAVGSGKGGVGKSTLSANLAIALARLGLKVGLVDADIYGPSQTRLMNVEGSRPRASEGKKLIPVPTPYGIPLLSMGQLVKPGQAIAWRGPMASNALGQLVDAEWGDVELLVIDLPPGTGDVQLSMVQQHKPAGALIVSTPQDLALMDATRAIDFFSHADVPVIGLVENMAGYACPHCGGISDPFGSGGAEAAAKSMELPFLGRIPLDIAIRKASDAGQPPAADDADEAFAAIGRLVKDWLAVH